jgi:HPt (histidine-containing phosphotransfer) domain-containing protein
MYAAQSPERLAELRAAHAAGDLVQLGRVAHSFKGASANLGARRVAATAKFLEHAGKTGDAARVPAWLDELDARYAEAEAALKALLPPTAQ